MPVSTARLLTLHNNMQYDPDLREMQSILDELLDYRARARPLPPTPSIVEAGLRVNLERRVEALEVEQQITAKRWRARARPLATHPGSPHPSVVSRHRSISHREDATYGPKPCPSAVSASPPYLPQSGALIQTDWGGFAMVSATKTCHASAHPGGLLNT